MGLNIPSFLYVVNKQEVKDSMLVLCVGVVLNVKSQLYDVFDSLYPADEFKFVPTVPQMDAFLETTTPQLVVYDATLASKRLRDTIKRLNSKGIKVLVISVDYKPESSLGYLNLGAIDVLEKPLRDHKIVSMLKKYVKYDYDNKGSLLSKKHHHSTKYIRSVKSELPTGLDEEFLNSL